MNEELTEIKMVNNKKKKLNANTIEDPAMNQPLGPGSYNADLDYTRKNAPGTNFGASKTTRDFKDRKKDEPGPDKYNQLQQSIGMKMMRGILKQEEAMLKEKRYNNEE